MKFKFLTLLVIFNIFAVISCQQTQTPSGSSSSNVNDNKITSLKTVVDKASEGSTIDLSQYSDITDWNVNINKAITISNGTINSGELTITASGVTLDNIKGSANVTTNSSMKISGSSIGNLTIGESDSRGDNIDRIIKLINTYNQELMVKIKARMMFEQSKVDKAEFASTAADSELIVSGETTEIKTLNIKSNCGIKYTNNAVKVTPDFVENGVNVSEETVAAFENYSVYSGSSQDDMNAITVENNVYSHTIGKDDYLFNSWMAIAIECSLSAGECGFITFEAMTDKNTYIVPEAMNAFCSANGTIVKTEANKWQTVSLYTGKYVEGCNNIVVEIPVETINDTVTLSVKNVKCSKAIDGDPDIPTYMAHPFSTTSLSGVAFSDNGNTLIFTSGDNSDDLCISIPVEEGVGLYKISYKVIADKTVNTFQTSANVNNSEGYGFCWAWGLGLELTAGTETIVESYIGVADGAWNTNYPTLIKGDVDKKPYFKIWIRLGRACIASFKEFKAEKISDNDMSNAVTIKWQQSENGKDKLYDMATTLQFNAHEGTIGKMVIFDKRCENVGSWWMPTNIDNKIILSANSAVWDHQDVDDLSIGPDNPDNDYYNGEVINFGNVTNSVINFKVSYTNECTLHFDLVQ